MGPSQRVSPGALHIKPTRRAKQVKRAPKKQRKRQKKELFKTI